MKKEGLPLEIKRKCEFSGNDAKFRVQGEKPTTFKVIFQAFTSAKSSIFFLQLTGS